MKLIVIVYPPQALTGVRHAAVVGNPRSLCGADIDGWFMDGSDPASIGCKRCERTYRSWSGNIS